MGTTIIHCWHYISQTPKAALLTTKLAETPLTVQVSVCVLAKKMRAITPPKTYYYSMLISMSLVEHHQKRLIKNNSLTSDMALPGNKNMQRDLSLGVWRKQHNKLDFRR